MNKKVKIFAITVLSLAGLMLAFTIFGSPKEDPDLAVRPSAPSSPSSSSTLSTSAGSIAVIPQSGVSMDTAVQAGDFSAMLANIKSIVIDDSIFSNPAYKALRDHPITLGTDIIGRPNPFAPVGTDNVDLSSAPTVQTLQPGKITSTSAEFSAQVSFSTTAPVTVVFQYGPTDQFGNVTSPLTLTKSGTAVVTNAMLSPNTRYYVQAVAVVGSSTTPGNTMIFTTTTSPGSN